MSETVCKNLLLLIRYKEDKIFNHYGVQETNSKKTDTSNCPQER